MTSTHLINILFCFAEELARFWSLFEIRMSSDPKLIKTLIDLVYANILSNDQLHVISDLSQEQFKHHLIIHIVRASVTSGVQKITSSFTTFLLQNHHYTTLYKQWKELGKKISSIQII